MVHWLRQWVEIDFVDLFLSVYYAPLKTQKQDDKLQIGFSWKVGCYYAYGMDYLRIDLYYFFKAN